MSSWTQKGTLNFISALDRETLPVPDVVGILSSGDKSMRRSLVPSSFLCTASVVCSVALLAARDIWKRNLVIGQYISLHTVGIVIMIWIIVTFLFVIHSSEIIEREKLSKSRCQITF